MPANRLCESDLVKSDGKLDGNKNKHFVQIYLRLSLNLIDNLLEAHEIDFQLVFHIHRIRLHSKEIVSKQ